MHHYRSLVLGVGLACASLTSFGQTVIGMSNSNATDKYRSMLQEAANAYTSSKPNIKLEAMNAQDDWGKQQGHIKDLIDRKVAAIIVLPVKNKTEPLTEAARKAGVPIVYVNQRPAEAMGNGAAYVGSDETMAGRLQAEQLVKKSGGKGEVFILKGEAEHDATINRTKGFKAVIAARPDLKVIGEEVGNWKRSEGKRLTADVLKKHPSVTAIVANNDEMAVGAIDALAEAGVPKGKVLVFGVDATAEALASVKDGSMAATVLQNARGQGRGAIDLALKMAAKENAPKELMIPFELVTLENIQRYAGK